MSAAQDVAQLLRLNLALNDARESLLERVQDGTATTLDGRLVRATGDALDFAIFAFRQHHYPDAAGVHVAGIRVVVFHADGTVTTVEAEQS